MKLDLTVKTWVEPITVSGNGIPFGSRRMYAVKSSIGSQAAPTSVAHWSRCVANRVAEEFSKSAQEQMKYLVIGIGT